MKSQDKTPPEMAKHLIETIGKDAGLSLLKEQTDRIRRKKSSAFGIMNNVFMIEYLKEVEQELLKI